MGPRLSAEERREGILRSSMDLFARRGFAGVSTRQLAAGAGISEAMLYRHFPRKQDLYRAILERHLEGMDRAIPLKGLAASDAPPERFFFTVADTLLRRMDEDPTLLRLMFHSALEGDPTARELERARAKGLRDAIESYIRRQARAGVLRTVDPRVASRNFVWLALGWGISRVLFEDPRARALGRPALVRRIVDQFLHGIGGGGIGGGGIGGGGAGGAGAPAGAGSTAVPVPSDRLPDHP